MILTGEVEAVETGVDYNKQDEFWCQQALFSNCAVFMLFLVPNGLHL